METMKINDDEMIQTMIAQHAMLREEMKNMHEQAINGAANGEKLHADMQALRKTLNDHLALESGIFYPRLLDKLEKKHFDTRNTREFIEQMKTIGVRVFGFLDEYDSVDVIVSDPGKYRVALASMSSILALRLSAEEDGVYMYWNM